MSGGSGTVTTFTPSATDPCYDPRMTRAQAIARRTAGTLKENCVIVITDGPTIGVPGMTSPTEIELNPTSPTEIGLAARVHTTFDNEAWTGNYDIDLGTGTITRLEDTRGNIVDDSTGDNVQNQFPWNFPRVQENKIEGSANLVGWQVPALAGVFILRNDIKTPLGAALTVDLTGLTVSGSQVLGNELTDAVTVTLTSAGGQALDFERNVMSGVSIVNFEGGVANFPVVSGNTFDGGARLDITSTGGAGAFFQMDENRFWDPFRATISPGAGVTSTFINANELRGGVNAPAPAAHLVMNKASGTFFMDENDFNADTDTTLWSFGGTAGDVISMSTFTSSGAVVSSTSGPMDIRRSEVNNSAVTSAGTAGVLFATSKIEASTWNQLGPGLLAANDSYVQQVDVQNTAGSTKGLRIRDSIVTGRGIIEQQRTAGVGIDTLSSISVHSNENVPVITLAGAGGAAGNAVVASLLEIGNGGSLVMNSPNNVFTRVRVSSAALITSVAAGTQQNIDVSGGGSLDLSTFAQNGVTQEGTFVTVLTAGNVNTLRNAGFSNVV